MMLRMGNSYPREKAGVEAAASDLELGRMPCLLWRKARRRRRDYP
jgi:hypothetical protein